MNLLNKIGEFFSRTETPIWWNLLAAVFGALFVLFVVPKFNLGFENNKIRTSFVLTKINQIDSTTNQVATLINEYTQACFSDPEADTSELARRFQQARFELDMRSVEILGMLSKDNHRETVKQLQATTGALVLGNNCVSEEELDQFIARISIFKFEALTVSQVLARSANL